MIKIWGRRSSSNVQAVMWMIGELNLEHKRIDAGFTYGVVDSPEYLAMNPNGSVPTIKDGENPPLWESGAILRYLTNSYAPKLFWPDALRARTQIDQWAEWSKINIALKFTAPVFWQVVRTAPSKRNPKAIESALATLTKFLTIADQRLAQSAFLAGDELTLADIQFGHCLYRYFDIDITRKPMPNIERYFDQISQRPAYQEHVMVPYDELRVTD